MFWEGLAWAQSQAAGSASPNTEAFFAYVVPMLLLFAVLYFVQVRPQVKKAREHQKMLSALKRNDEVVTAGGLIGRIVELGDKIVTLEIAPQVRVRVERSQIAALSSYGKTPKGTGKKEDQGQAKGN